MYMTGFRVEKSVKEIALVQQNEYALYIFEFKIRKFRFYLKRPF